MRRVLAVALLASLAGPAAGAQDPFLQVAGSIMLPNPTSKHGYGLTEFLGPCGGSHPDLGVVNGVDGFWIALPEGAGGRTARLEWPLTDEQGNSTDTVEAMDMDAWFYDDICELITPSRDEDAYSMATLNIGGDPGEEGVVPADANWVVVNLVLGVESTFTFVVE